MGSSFDVFSGRRRDVFESDESSSDDEYGEELDDEAIGNIL